MRRLGIQGIRGREGKSQPMDTSNEEDKKGLEEDSYPRCTREGRYPSCIRKDEALLALPRHLVVVPIVIGTAVAV